MNQNQKYHQHHKDQINLRHRLHRRTIVGKIVELLKHCRARRHCTLTSDYILGLWKKTQGCCSVTGEPMTYKGKLSPTTLSLDRIDVKQGYTESNIRLVCFWVNSARGSLDDQDLRKWCKAAIDFKAKTRYSEKLASSK